MNLYDLTVFRCESIEGTLRLSEDLEIECYSRNHKIIAYAIALPGAIIWGKSLLKLDLSILGLGIPAFFFYTLLK